MTPEAVAHVREVLSWWTKGPDCPGQAPAGLAWSADGRPDDRCCRGVDASPGAARSSGLVAHMIPDDRYSCRPHMAPEDRGTCRPREKPPGKASGGCRLTESRSSRSVCDGPDSPSLRSPCSEARLSSGPASSLRESRSDSCVAP